MLFFVWLEFNDAQTQNIFNKIEVFLFHLSPENGFPHLKITWISSYGYFAAIMSSVNLDVNKIAEYKSISTHILLAYPMLKNDT